jgi:hypothetical protein
MAVLLVPQEVDNWCWAASAQMIMSYFGKNVAQCEQANDEFRRTDCCVSAKGILPANCDSGGWPQFERYGFTYFRTHNAPLSWEMLQQEIAGKRPVAFSWGWTQNAGQGHMMVAIGYLDAPTGRLVFVNDPWPPSRGEARQMSYDQYVAADDHIHWDDFYVIKGRLP